MGSNGLTSARHDILYHALAEKFPESYDPAVPDDLVYSGSRELLAEVPGTGLTVGELILSPTRTYAPLVAKLLKEMRPAIHGLIHCTGGAQTKVMNLSLIHIFDNRDSESFLYLCIKVSEEGHLSMKFHNCPYTPKQLLI